MESKKLKDFRTTEEFIDYAKQHPDEYPSHQWIWGVPSTYMTKGDYNNIKTNEDVANFTEPKGEDEKDPT